MTFKRRAYDEVTIAHGGNTVALRPSLRAATILEERHGIPALFKAITEPNLTIISDIIRVSATHADDAAAFLFSPTGRPLFPFFLAVHQPLAELLSMFLPAPDPKAKPSTGKPIPWCEVYASLYDCATGWLGWTPETAWNATPTEITRAHAAMIERLVTTGVLVRKDKADNSTPTYNPEQMKDVLAEGHDPAFDRGGLHSLKSKQRMTQ